MSSDDFYNEDLGNDFTAADEVPEADKQLGLVVPGKARQIWDPVTRELLWDELADWEAEYRARGRPVLVFEEEDADDGAGNAQP